MKLKFLPILFMSILALVSCSDDDDDPVVAPVQTAKHFNGNELSLKIGNNVVLGKDILFTPDANDPTAATLTFAGAKFDVNAAMNEGNRAETKFAYATSSIFAGEATVDLPIKMELTGDLGKFGGNGESKYYTFDYTGSVLENNLEVVISNVVLKNNPIANTTWKLAPVIQNDWGEQESTPFIIEWKADKMVDLDMFGSVIPMPAEDVLKMAIGVMPLIEIEEGKKVTVAEAIVAILQTIGFENDGNLKATYMDLKTKQPVVSPYGVAQYVVEGDKIKLVLNPFAIAATAKKDNNAQAEESPMTGMMQAIVPMILESINAEDKLVNGVDITYTLDGNKMSVCLDETLFLPVLKVLSPMLENEDIINAAIEMLKQNPDMAAFAPTMGSVLKSLPEVINTTTSMKIGFNLIKM